MLAAGGITNGSQSLGGITPTIISAPKTTIDKKGNDVKTKFAAVTSSEDRARQRAEREIARGIGAIGAWGQKVENAITGKDTPLDLNAWYMLPSVKAQAIREGKSEDIEKKTEGWIGSDTSFGNLYSGAFNLGASMMDSATVAALTTMGVPAWMGAVAMGSAAATSTMQSTAARGLPADRALALGTIVGFTEMFFEKYSIETLLDNIAEPENVRQLLWNAAKQGGINSIEEGSTTVVNSLADMFISGDYSEYEIAKRNYMADGKTEEEAKKLASSDWLKGFTTDLIGGFVSGDLMTSAFGGINLGAKKITNVTQNTTAQAQSVIPVTNDTSTAQQTAGIENAEDPTFMEGFNNAFGDLENIGTNTAYDLKENPYTGKSLLADSSVYDYDFLVNLPPMDVKEMPPLTAVKDGNNVSQQKAIELGLQNAAEVGHRVGDKVYAIRNKYTGHEILVGQSGLGHSLGGENVSRLRTNARLTAIGGSIIQNAVPVNALKNKNAQAQGTYAMAGLLKSGDRSVVAIVTIEQHTDRMTELDFVDVTHSVNGRINKEESRSSTRETGLDPATTSFSISIADFLEIVNHTHQSILSKDVLAHLGEERNGQGYYADQVQFSLNSDSENVPNSGLLQDDAIKERLILDGFEQELDADSVVSTSAYGRGYIDQMAKDLKMAVEFVNSIWTKYGREANGSMDGNGNMQISRNADKPEYTVVVHEATHRMKQLAPESYRVFCDFAVQMNPTAMEQIRQQYGEDALTAESAMDEVAAAFAEEIFRDENKLRQFIEEAGRTPQTRNAVQQFFDMLREVIQKLKETVSKLQGKGQAEAASQLSESLSNMERAEQLWKETYLEAKGSAGRLGNGLVRKSSIEYNGEGVTYSRKGYQRPNLTPKEWDMLNYHQKHDIGNETFSFTDDTYWLFKNTKGVLVFAVYGGGDVTDPTTFYASGKKQAQKDFAKFKRFVEGSENGTHKNRTALDRVLESLTSENGSAGRGMAFSGDRRADAGNVQIPVKEQGRHGRGDSENGKTNSRSGMTHPLPSEKEEHVLASVQEAYERYCQTTDREKLDRLLLEAFEKEMDEAFP